MCVHNFVPKFGALVEFAKTYPHFAKSARREEKEHADAGSEELRSDSEISDSLSENSSDLAFRDDAPMSDKPTATSSEDESEYSFSDSICGRMNILRI